MDVKAIKFSGNSNQEFYKTLKKRVHEYFKSQNISHYANTEMVIKTIFMLCLYIVPLVLMLTVVESWWLTLIMWAIMGFGMAGIGLSIMHDANHGAYSRNRIVNSIFGKLLNLVGGCDFNWKIQHNVLHHTYTNVTGMDEDIDSGALMRFSPNQKLRKGHKYQFIYAWFLYGLMTVSWTLAKDFNQYVRYKKKNLIKTQGVSPKRMFSEMMISKVLYLGVVIALPVIFSPVPWWLTLIGAFMMHFIAGLVLGCIFQPAHVIPSSEFPVPDKTGIIEEDWAISQLLNTANFAPKARLFSWYVGGLNYQIEHHLFPNICHVHYKNISRIVRDTAFEYNLPYYSYKTFGSALYSHAKMLYALGRK